MRRRRRPPWRVCAGRPEAAGRAARKAVGVHQAERHQLGKRFLGLRGQEPGAWRDLIEEGRALRGQILRHALRARDRCARIHDPPSPPPPTRSPAV